MEAIEAFLQAGGTVYLSGAVGHPRLYQLLEAEDHGLTAHTVTYMEPTETGRLLCQVPPGGGADLPEYAAPAKGRKTQNLTGMLPP